MAVHELVLSLVLDGPKEKYYQCWTTPELLVQWFAPKPYSTPSAELDVRPGGSCNVTMRSPDGVDMPNPGVYLDVVPNRKLVFTDAFTSAWTPKDGAPFMVAQLTFDDAPGGNTKYVATARHWSAEAMEQHKQMGFTEGWTICARQLEELVRTL